jgi:hypothetical protein
MLQSTHMLSIIVLLGGYNQGSAFFQSKPTFLVSRPCTSSSTLLHGGVGTATSYSWTEEPFELEINFLVPEGTRAKDVVFQALPRSVDLRLTRDDGSELILLDPKRLMRGRVSTDGTFWEIHDVPETAQRQITVQIEKNHRTPKDDFDVIDYDWGGVFPNDDDEVLSRTYDEPEPLNIREYAASLGVDIDNINMSLVDKTMFTSGLNMTRSTMDQLSSKGLVKEVTQQADGSEFTTDDDGASVAYNPYAAVAPPKIPFIDTPSPWSKSIPVQEMEMTNGVPTALKDSVESEPTASDDEEEPPDVMTAADPIDLLTVKRLKDILRLQGLKVSGTKDELQNRLRTHVNSMLNNKNDPSADESTTVDV